MTTYTSNPTNPGLSADELTALVNEERYARTVANIARRAENLWDDGYRWSKFADSFYTVFTPKGDVYTVLTAPDAAPACDCPAYEKYQTCKHYLAVLFLIREEELAAEFDRMMANAEGPLGCDPHCEF